MPAAGELVSLAGALRAALDGELYGAAFEHEHVFWTFCRQTGWRDAPACTLVISQRHNRPSTASFRPRRVILSLRGVNRLGSTKRAVNRLRPWRKVAQSLGHLVAPFRSCYLPSCGRMSPPHPSQAVAQSIHAPASCLLPTLDIRPPCSTGLLWREESSSLGSRGRAQPKF